MIDYIFEKTNNTPRHFRFGGIEVIEHDPISPDFDINFLLKTIENHFPSHYFNDLKALNIIHLDEFDSRNVNAVYRDNQFYITNRQDDINDLLDDIVHEFAHHLEVLFPEEIYSDKRLITEFLTKRKELEFELRTEGYWTDKYDFSNLKFDQSFDDFLYKRVGRNMLRMVTSGLFIRPYAAVSLREYFATGFEAYYLGQAETLQKISPILYDKINKLHNYTD